MNFYKNDKFQKNIKLNKRANSNISVLKTCPEENNANKNPQAELIHLSLLIDEGNKITTEFYNDEDISEICKKIQEKFKLSEKIKVKLQDRIQSQIKESSNQSRRGEKDIKVNNLLKRLYNDSVEKTKNSKIFNEKLRIAKEEKELATLKFSPTLSTLNLMNTKRKHAQIEDKIYYDSVLKKNKLEVDRVLKGMNNYLKCKQYVYKENILNKNAKEKCSPFTHTKKNSLNFINSKSINSDKILLRENSKLFPIHNILRSECSLGISRNKTDSELKEDIFYSGKTERKSQVDLNTSSQKDKNDTKESPSKRFLRTRSKMSEENMAPESRNKSKRTTLSIDNTSINTNHINFLANQLKPEVINQAGIHYNPLQPEIQPLKKVAEYNLVIPDEQSVNGIKKKTFYADLYRKIHNSNSNLNNLSKDNVAENNALVNNKYYNRTLSKSSAKYEEGKKSTEAKIIQRTYNNLYIDNRIVSNKDDPIKQIDIIAPYDEKKSEKEKFYKQFSITHVNSSKQNNITAENNSKNCSEDNNNSINTNLKFGKVLKSVEIVKNDEEKEIRGPRHFSFKDFQDYSGNFLRNNKEELGKNEKREKLTNISEIEITSNPSTMNNQTDLRSNLKPDANSNKVQTVTGTELKASNSFRDVKETMSHQKNQKLMKKLDNIHDRLYKSHEDIKKKKEDHVKNVFRNLYPFKPNVNQSRPKSIDSNSKIFPTSRNNKDRQNIFERLHSSNRTQNIARSILSSPSMASDRLSNTNFKTERSKKMLSSKSTPILSTKDQNNSKQTLREKNMENQLYDSFLKNNQIKEKLKNHAQKKSHENINNFKLKNLKEIFEIIYNNCRSVEDFQNMEKFGITKLMKENLIIPTSFLINERNLDFNFGNFYLIANELMNNIIY